MGAAIFFGSKYQKNSVRVSGTAIFLGDKCQKMVSAHQVQPVKSWYFFVQVRVHYTGYSLELIFVGNVRILSHSHNLLSR